METSISPNEPIVNVGKKERTLSAIAGSLLIYYTVKKHKADALLLLGGGYLLYRAVSGHCAIYSSVSRRDSAHGRNINVRESVVVNKPREDVYAFWRKLENLPLFMTHLDSVWEIDDKRSAWKVKTPGDIGHIQWEAEIVKERPGAEISWKSLPGASIENAGKIRFTDTAGLGTRIDAVISYRPPKGMVAEAVLSILKPVFSDLIAKDILNFKHYVENAATFPKH